jgi:hypothetical protein
MTNGKRNVEAVAHSARCNNAVLAAHEAVNAAAVRTGDRNHRLSKVKLHDEAGGIIFKQSN